MSQDFPQVLQCVYFQWLCLLRYYLFTQELINNNNGIHFKLKNVRMCKNVQGYYNNQVTWQHSANKDAGFIRTSDILKLFYILKISMKPLNY